MGVSVERKRGIEHGEKFCFQHTACPPPPLLPSPTPIHLSVLNISTPALPSLVSVSFGFSAFPSLILQKYHSEFRADLPLRVPLRKKGAKKEKDGEREKKRAKWREVVSERRPDRDRGNQSF